jgi:hypothetical protein
MCLQAAQRYLGFAPVPSQLAQSTLTGTWPTPLQVSHCNFNLPAPLQLAQDFEPEQLAQGTQPFEPQAKQLGGIQAPPAPLQLEQRVPLNCPLP